MKILFFSDIHFHSTHRFSQITSDGFTTREKEHLQCADVICNLIDKYNIDKVVFGGDMFLTVGDTLSTQVLYAVACFIEKVQSKCLEKNIQFDLLVGNHDLSSTTNNQFSNKLVAFKGWSNVNIYDRPCIIDNFIYMPYCTDDNKAFEFLSNIENKEDKIIFSHLEIKDIDLGNGILTKKGVSIDLLKKFKMVLQGHYHSGNDLCKNIRVVGSTQRLSFKDRGKSRKNIIIYDTNTSEIKRESFNCPDWLTFTDDNIDTILNISNDNYIKINLSTDLLLTDEIKDKINQFKDKDISIDVNRISLAKNVNNEIHKESEIDVIIQFINKSETDAKTRQNLIEEGQRLLNVVQGC